MFLWTIPNRNHLVDDSKFTTYSIVITVAVILEMGLVCFDIAGQNSKQIFQQKFPFLLKWFLQDHQLREEDGELSILEYGLADGVNGF